MDVDEVVDDSGEVAALLELVASWRTMSIARQKLAIAVVFVML